VIAAGDCPTKMNMFALVAPHTREISNIQMSKQKALKNWVFQLDEQTERLTIWLKTGDEMLPMTPVATMKKQEWKALERFLKQNV